MRTTTSTRSSASSGRRGDDGTGVVGTVVGVFFFLTLLLFAVQVLLGLYATTVVTAATYDAAKAVAGASGPTVGVAEDVARRRIGRLGDQASFAWVLDGDVIVLTVRVPRPVLLPLPMASHEVVRTVRVRVEAVQ
jgi:hypothetical protein